MTLPAEYFDKLYAGDDDPWRFAERWYEHRKRALTVASLPHARYARAFEIGCSIGTLTAELAQHCDELIAVDTAPAAIDAARSRLAGAANVEFAVMRVPGDWPRGTFDLIVVSEVAYYFDEATLSALLTALVSSLNSGGILLACHWRHPVRDYPLSGDRVHELIRAVDALTVVSEYLDEDFRLEVFSSGTVESVGRREGLVS